MSSCPWPPVRRNEASRRERLALSTALRFTGWAQRETEYVWPLPLGDHTGYLLAPETAQGRAPSPDAYLRFRDVKDLDPGHPA